MSVEGKPGKSAASTRKSAPKKKSVSRRTAAAKPKPKDAVEAGGVASAPGLTDDSGPSIAPRPEGVTIPPGRRDDRARHIKTLIGLLVVWGSFYLVALAHQISEDGIRRASISGVESPGTTGDHP